MTSASRQSGNVLFIIFIGIALFAALSYAVSSGMRGGGQSVNKEKASLHVGEMLQYGNQLSLAIKTIKTLNRCNDAQISFENPVNTEYANPNSPGTGTKDCWVFDPAGGGARYNQPSADYLKSEYSSSAAFGKWYFAGRFCIPDVGSGGSSCAAENAELMLILPYINDNLCEELRILSGSGIVPSVNITFNLQYFRGSFGNSPLTSSNIRGKKMGCFSYNGVNSFFYILLAR